MLKKTQRLIIVSVILLTLLTLSTIGSFLYFEYEKMIRLTPVFENIREYNLFISNLQNAKNIILILSGIFLIISVVLSIILSKTILLPIEELVYNAQQILNGDSKQIKSLKDSNKEKDKIDDLVLMFSDMNSDLKDNLTEITRKKNEIETILLHMSDGVISFDIYGKITHINPAAKKALNVDETWDFKKISKEIGLTYDLEKIAYIEKYTTQKFQLEKVENIYNIFFAPLKTAKDKVDGLVIVLQEITEHVKLDKMRKQFIADVSHELKTPITSILGYSEIIMDDENLEKEKTQYFAKKMNNEALRMSELVQDLLTLSKYDKGNIEKKKETFQLAEVVKEYVENFKPQADKKNINMSCYITTNIPEIYGDKFGIIRVITNILSNAIKYTQENGQIEVYVGFLYAHTYVKIKDNGIGIKEEDLNRVFERFYRVDSSRVRASGGSGLGLAIAKEIIEKNDGSISIKSEYKKGTEVVLRFKAVQKRKII